MVIDAETDRILGAAAVCEQGSELVQLFVELMNADATATSVRDAIHIHPTLAEAAKNAVLDACRSPPIDRTFVAGRRAAIYPFTINWNATGCIMPI